MHEVWRGQRSRGLHWQLDIPWTWRRHPRIDVFPRAVGVHGVTVGVLVHLLVFLFVRQQHATSVWRLNIIIFVSLFSRSHFESNELYPLQSRDSIRVAACRYITHRCRIINPSCHIQGFLIWLAVPLKVWAYSPPLGLQIVASRPNHPLTDNLIDRRSSSVAQSTVSVPVLHRRAGRWGGEVGRGSCWCREGLSLVEEAARTFYSVKQ